MKIVFIGCVRSSEIFLKSLVENKFEISGVITKKSSKFNADFCDVTPYCKAKNIEVFYTENINNDETVCYLKNKNPDTIYCLGWSQILDKVILNIPRYGVIGFHPSKLPYNRGRHPIIWALVLGLNETASTFFWINEGIDTGAIVSQECINIYYEDDANTLYNRITDVASKQIIEISKKIENNTLFGQIQDPVDGNSWRKRSVNDGKIDWRMSSGAIYNLVRGLTKPYVGSHFVFNGKDIKVWKVEEILDQSYENIEPGKVIKYNSGTDFYVKVYDNIIHVMNCDMIEIRQGEYL
jgi:Methionyl-tRNA formyltransferase